MANRLDKAIPGVNRPRPWPLPLLLLPALFWSLAFFAPLSAVISRGVESWSVGKVLTSYQGLWLFTLKQAGLSTLAAVILGLPGAALLGRHSFPGKKLLRSLSTIPFVIPPLLVALGFVLVFGNKGIFNSLLSLFGGKGIRILYSLKGLVLAHVFYNFPLTLRIVGDAWGRIPGNLIRAAETLGASPWRIRRTIILPHLAPSLLTAATITFLYCFLSFAIVLVLGGGPEFSTLEVEIYRLITQRLDISTGSALALGETLTALVILGLCALGIMRMRQFFPRGLEGAPPCKPIPLRGATFLKVLPYLVLVFLFVLGPLAAIVGFSFLQRSTRSSPPALTTEHWIRLLGGGRVGLEVPLQALGTSMLLALATALTAIILGSMAAWGRARKPVSGIIEVIIALPLGTSSIILGLGYLILVRQIPGGNFFRTVSLLMVHTVTALPLVYYLVAGRLRELPPRLGEAAASLGASRQRIFFTIDYPLARGSLATAAIFAFAISIGELNATLILAPTGFSTIPLAIYRLAAAYDIFGACALGSLLMVMVLPAFLLLDRYGENLL